MRILVIVQLLIWGLCPSASPATPQRRRVPSKTASRKSAPHKKLPLVDPTEGDNIDGDELTIRRAAVTALGPQNGSVVVVDPDSGRILSMVNQKLALTSGFTPCSTIKLVTSVAALNEGLVSRETVIRTTRYARFDLTNAIAHSDNQYFSILGNRLGLERVQHYAHMLGLGERAGLDVAGEKPGVVPEEAPKWGGVGMMTSFGEGFQVTPMELAALISAIANGGTLYYLQYPKTADEIEQFRPQVKRKLEVAPDTIEDLRFGMRGAVDFGTARRANYDPNEPILGKTGTCTDFRISSHMGWFASFNEVGHHRLVVVVMLTGTKAVNGPVAAGVAGAIYRNLSEQRYFAGASTNGMPEVTTTYPVR